MLDEPTQERPVHPRDEAWLATLPRARETDKNLWRSVYCLLALRRADGVAPIVLEPSEGQCLRPPAKYEGAFELCLRHLHGRFVPMDGAPCTVGALLANRAAEALKLPGRWVGLPDGAMEELRAPPLPEASTREHQVPQEPCAQEPCSPEEFSCAPRAPEGHDAPGEQRPATRVGEERAAPPAELPARAPASWDDAEERASEDAPKPPNAEEVSGTD